jgi:membrane protein DedA with SNARE-associated domain
LVTHSIETSGLILLFALVAIESAGIPLPGETALITAAVLAGGGHFNIAEVIAVAAAGAIVGDNIGYWIARKGGRGVIARIPLARDALPRLLPRGEAFFARHGPKTVVIARFFAGLRVTIAWLAGLSRMEWPKFFLYNAVGGILWATTIGLAAYYFGQKAVEAVTKYGLYAAIVIVVVAVLAFFGYRWLHRRRDRRDDAGDRKSLVESMPQNEVGDRSDVSVDEPSVADK